MISFDANVLLRLFVNDDAAQVGYADGVTLRTLLRRKLRRGVRELRSR